MRVALAFLIMATLAGCTSSHEPAPTPIDPSVLETLTNALDDIAIDDSGPPGAAQEFRPTIEQAIQYWRDRGETLDLTNGTYAPTTVQFVKDWGGGHIGQ